VPINRRSGAPSLICFDLVKTGRMERDDRLRNNPTFRRRSFERCLNYLDACLILLAHPPTKSMRLQGWTEEQLAVLHALVTDWRREFEEDGEFTVRQHRIMIRWFLDADLDFDAVSLLMATVDNTVYRALGLP
jgi:hypothetical protein